jgi:hypothetical protein
MMTRSRYIIGDGMCVVFGSVLRGCGLQVMAAKVVVFSYYVIGVPLAILLAFKTEAGVVGLAWGITVGAAAVASFVAAVLTEMYLCGVCSCQEILRGSGRGQAPTPTPASTRCWCGASIGRSRAASPWSDPKEAAAPSCRWTSRGAGEILMRP